MPATIALDNPVPQRLTVGEKPANIADHRQPRMIVHQAEVGREGGLGWPPVLGRRTDHELALLPLAPRA
jgi:hypothetical protein